ncbi:hypothetical protein [Rhizobium sp. S163]|uniref:hypothetical protein n=1 Tax=Rhizobium sp. S163 TaxID=3055039 RepID=UPI000DB9D105|nr:hypothetical protein [Rhizobium sp. S163]MDM9644864.1 hypothetical protein [Rhizobium sp. S163]
MRILIVEDEFFIAINVEDVVATLGHEVLGPVGTSEEAREVAAEADIAIVDLQLADGFTGSALADNLGRRKPRWD